jgi:hypothetical protein
MAMFDTLSTGADIFARQEEQLAQAATWRQSKQAERARKAGQGGVSIRSMRVRIARLLIAVATGLAPTIPAPGLGNRALAP